ncbi:MAG: hypothetical protein HZC42_14010 [Candidatus Eisenbacteria bacterium]|nr:hypothetical protein [Candidatus Eisenbacteria bacterium]
MSLRAWLLAVSLAAAVPCAAQAPASVPAVPDFAGPALLAPAVAVIPTPPDFPRGKISGVVFGDYYGNLAGDPRHAYSSSGADSGRANIDNSGKPITRDLNGFQIRRIYFQLDNDLSIRVSTRFRLEADGRSLASDGKLGVSVKGAYLQVRRVCPRGDLFFGVISTPTFDGVEEFWQYRSVEKTLTDFRGLGGSTDLGAALRGSFDPDRRFGYALMVGNGAGQKPEDNRYKRLYASLPVRAGALRIEPYADYESAAGGRDRATYKLFVGYEPGRAAIGVELLDRVDHRSAGGNQEPVGASLFVRGAPREQLAAFARVDLYRPDRRAADRVDSQLWIAGLDWQPFRDVHFMPNLEAVQYRARGAAVAPAHHDLQARLTISYKFSKPQS